MHFSEQEVAYENAEPFSLNLTLNDGLVAELNQTQDIQPSIDAAADNPLAGSARVSDASDIYQEVQLRHPEHEKRRPMRRPIAILSDLFTVKRTKSISSDTKLNKTPDLPPRNRLSSDDCKTTVSNKTLKKKRSIWNLMSKSKKCRSTNSIADQKTSQNAGHPLSSSSLTELNLNNGNYIKFDSYDNIFDLNSMPDIDDMLKVSECKLNASKTAETRRSTVSINIMWSHNLSRSFTSQGDVSNINLIGANVNREQIHSEVFIEQDSRHMAFDVPVPKNFLKFRKYEIDANGYAVMRPIITEATKDSQLKSDSSNTTYVSIDDIARNARNLECNYDIIRKPPRRKLSFDSQSSSGCSSDNEDQACEAQPEKLQPGEANSDDEAISMKFTECSPLPSPTKSTGPSDDWCDSNPPEKQNECAILENDVEPLQNNASGSSSTSYKMATEASNQESSFTTAAELESDESFTTTAETNDVPQMITNAEEPSNKLETGEEMNGEFVLQIVEQPVHIDSKQCSLSTRSMIQIEITRGQPCANHSGAKAQSLSKRIWHTCTEFRKMAGSLVSVRRAMLNLAY